MILELWIEGSIVPKARPRVTSGRAYLPESYRQWRNQTEITMRRLTCNRRHLLPFTKPVEVEILIQGKHRGDLDNIAGACLDSLVSAEIISDDRLSCVSRLTIEHLVAVDKGFWIKISERGLTRSDFAHKIFHSQYTGDRVLHTIG